ncbi:hypothetical protein CEXT_605751 [Caerostris extrusa]|uniref:Uncharacterized protein n=1 Tax=Caerostris extrusa TaxID=172846 RepID=A0AAV4MAE7_CAEEX|nr:hypothetical protein CEXT_605751 [Caerostris extrusa]
MVHPSEYLSLVEFPYLGNTMRYPAGYSVLVFPIVEKHNELSTRLPYAQFNFPHLENTMAILSCVSTVENTMSYRPELPPMPSLISHIWRTQWYPSRISYLVEFPYLGNMRYPAKGYSVPSVFHS